MKPKDIATLAVAAIISAFFSFFISKYTFVTPKNRQQTVESVPLISAKFPLSNNNLFDSHAIDPTQLVNIGNSTNPSPFNSSGH